jgi:MoaA/NifB/PqqE/SkfB family radical SAM enzyme
MEFFGSPIRSFNIEITNRCTLGCPECARTNNDWILSNLTDLPLAVLENVFPVDRRENFEGLRVNLCGAYGDCIYHRQFHDVLRHLKAAGIRVNMETNGSHRKLKWWQQTCEILTDEDVITFSVDGLENTNHIYRINARWDDIEKAMRYCAERVNVDWKFIVFRHNEHQLDEAKKLARDIGVRGITFKKSGRFGEDDPLAPRSDDYIGVVTQNRRKIDALIRSGADSRTIDEQLSIVQKCRFGKDLAITPQGHFLPCTTSGPSGPQGWFYENRDHFDLKKRGIEEILGSAKWYELESLWQAASRAPRACLAYCGVHRDFLDQYAEHSRVDRPNKPQDSISVAIGG